MPDHKSLRVQPPYTYTWFKDGGQVGTASSYEDWFPWNGNGGGSYQFTLRVDVRDAQNVLASDTKVVTAFNSGGGAQMAENLHEQSLKLPDDFTISQNYPNPFNPETQINYGLPEPSEVTINISDLLGREVIRFANSKRSAGYHVVKWNGVDGFGNKVGSGIYFYRITAVGESRQTFTKVLKMVMAK